ncbi:glycosyltransferase [Enterovirga sp.]|uniref:glycosyltransferase family protein n=1 Tax=Enterovirga sp. TaxID=2026350 RepID=UPI0026383A30|nr:glycosyltransferase [Enterovirga sp.]MDB5591785.1 glycosyltransferase 28 domain protein [Enterovirga sp.]
MTRRILIVVTHLLGAGHLTRAAALARAAARSGHRVTLVSGGMPSRLVSTDGVELIQLPPVRAPLADFTALQDEGGHPVRPERLAARQAMLLEALATTRPDVVVTELFPFGRRVLAAEFMALIEAARSSTPRPGIVASVRDILVAPERPAKLARTEDLVQRHYDAVLVHGDPALVPLEASWPVGAELRQRLRYTGYVDNDGEPGPVGSPSPDPALVLVSGGSSAASLPVYRTALAAAAETPRLRWQVLVGHGVAEQEFRSLQGSARAGVTVERARPDFRTLMRKSAVFVGQAGYNTVMDIVATQARAVLVPFEQGRETEQRLRASALAERGLATLLPEAELDAASLAGAVLAALSRTPPRFPALRLDGATETVRCLEELATSARPVAAGAAA